MTDPGETLLGLISISLVGGVIGRGLIYLLNFIIANGLGPEAVGVFAFGTVLMNFGSVLAKAGLDGAVGKLVPVYENDGADPLVTGTLVFAFASVAAVGTVVAAGILLVARADIGLLSPTTTGLTLFAISVPIVAMLRVGTRASQAFKETKYAAITKDLIQPTMAILAAAIGGYVVVDVQFVIAGYVASFLVGVLAITYFLQRQGAFTGRSGLTVDIRRISRLSPPLFLANVSRYLTFWTDVLMLGIFVPAAALGTYQIAYQTSVILTFLLLATNSLFPALVAGHYDEGNMERLREIYSVVTKWLVLTAGFGYAFVVIYSREILGLFGSEFVAAVVPLWVLLTAQLLSVGVGPAGFLLTMSEYERLEMANAAVVALLNLALNYVFIQRIGIVGAAIATAVSITMLNVARLAQVRYFLGLHPYSRRYLPGGAVVVTSAVVTWLARGVPVSDQWSIVLGALVSGCTFVAGIRLVGLHPEDRVLLSSV